MFVAVCIVVWTVVLIEGNSGTHGGGVVVRELCRWWMDGTGRGCERRWL